MSHFLAVLLICSPQCLLGVMLAQQASVPLAFTRDDLNCCGSCRR